MRRVNFRSLNLVLFISIFLVVYAIECNAMAYEVQPKYASIAIFSPRLSISNDGYSRSYCEVSLIDESLSIKLTVDLQQFKDGNWKTIQSWNSNGTGRVKIDKAYYVLQGYPYRIYATAVVTDSGGKVLESPSETSKTLNF